MVLRRSARVLLNHLRPARLPGPMLQWFATSGEDQPPRQSHPSIRRERLCWWMTSSRIAPQSPATPPPRRCQQQHRSTMRHSTHPRRPRQLWQYIRSLVSSIPSSSKEGTVHSTSTSRRLKPNYQSQLRLDTAARTYARRVSRSVGRGSEPAGLSYSVNFCSFAGRHDFDTCLIVASQWTWLMAGMHITDADNITLFTAKDDSHPNNIQLAN